MSINYELWSNSRRVHAHDTIITPESKTFCGIKVRPHYLVIGENQLTCIVCKRVLKKKEKEAVRNETKEKPVHIPPVLKGQLRDRFKYRALLETVNQFLDRVKEADIDLGPQPQGFWNKLNKLTAVTEQFEQDDEEMEQERERSTKPMRPKENK